ncbi:MAG: hypothetical protein ACLUNO_04315 [Oscillospiraceae bacterium]
MPEAEPEPEEPERRQTWSRKPKLKPGRGSLQLNRRPKLEPEADAEETCRQRRSRSLKFEPKEAPAAKPEEKPEEAPNRSRKPSPETGAKPQTADRRQQARAAAAAE